MLLHKIWLAPFAIAALAPASAASQTPAAPPPQGSIAPQVEILDFAIDRTERMTVPVSVAGTGPYPFIVDTGAERTVIARDLARKLGLDAGRTAVMHSMTEVSSVETVVIPSLQVSSQKVTDIHAPALARVDLGAAGMLGVDSLQDHRVVLDFKEGTMTVSPSAKREPRWKGDEIVVTARRRFGQLILADAKIDGDKVYVIVDTGAQLSVGNAALRRKLLGRAPKDPNKMVEMRSVTGGSMFAEWSVIDSISIGGLDVNDLPVAFADAHPFKKLGLEKKPALLLGMDALRLFDRVSVDFASKKVRFLLPDEAGRDRDIMLAMR